MFLFSFLLLLLLLLLVVVVVVVVVVVIVVVIVEIALQRGYVFGFFSLFFVTLYVHDIFIYNLFKVLRVFR